MKKYFIFLIIISFCLTVISTYAQATPPITPTAPLSPKTNTKPVELPNPLGKDNPKPEVIIGKVIQKALGVVGSLALVMFIYGGIVWMTSAGNSEKVEKGKNIIVWAVIGLVVIFSSYALVKFVIETAAG